MIQQNIVDGWKIQLSSGGLVFFLIPFKYGTEYFFYIASCEGFLNPTEFTRVWAQNINGLRLPWVILVVKNKGSLHIMAWKKKSPHNWVICLTLVYPITTKVTFFFALLTYFLKHTSKSPHARPNKVDWSPAHRTLAPWDPAFESKIWYGKYTRED